MNKFDVDVTVSLSAQAGLDAWRPSADMTKALQEAGRLIYEGDAEQLRFAQGSTRLRTRVRTQPRRKPSLKRVEQFADLFGLGLRKRMKAMLGDFDEEIARLHKRHQYRLAKWNQVLAWGYAIWYMVQGPLDWAIGWAIKSWKGQ